MTDRLKESLSAWIDDEASEIEVHQLLRQYKAEAAVHDEWLGLQHASAATRGRVHLSQQQHLALHASISAVIFQDEVVHGQGASLAETLPTRPVAAWLRPAGGLALAASLVIAVFVGMQPQFDGGATSAPVAGGQPARSLPAQTYALDAMPSGQSLPGQNLAAAPEYETVDGQTELKALDETRQRQLRNYLRQHDQMVRMNPNAMTVLFEAQGNQ